METNKLTPEKSMELINQVIKEAKNRFEENGLIYIMWGVLVALAAFGQYFLLKSGHSEMGHYPYLLMPLGFIITWIYMARKECTMRNQIGKIIGIAWMILAINLLVLGFGFASVLQQNLMPVLLILIGIGMSISGASIRSSLVIFSGILINVSGLICFKLDWMYHSLIMGIAALVAILIPGILLMIKYNKNKNV